jgi:hypothetical protein
MARLGCLEKEDVPYLFDRDAWTLYRMHTSDRDKGESKERGTMSSLSGSCDISPSPCRCCCPAGHRLTALSRPSFPGRDRGQRLIRLTDQLPPTVQARVAPLRRGHPLGIRNYEGRAPESQGETRTNGHPIHEIIAPPDMKNRAIDMGGRKGPRVMIIKS